MSTNRKPLEFKTAKANKPSAKLRPFDRRHKDFLDFVANGHSIGDACAMLGATRAAYEKWRNRVEGFKAAVQAARESHRRDIACGFHGADAYARSLLDAIQRDESLAPALRYRASKTILTRKGKKDWLPDAIPADTEPLAPYDEEQPESLTDGFVYHPHRTEAAPVSPDTTINGTPASRAQSRSEAENTSRAAGCRSSHSESESANSATKSCCHRQSESASDARGSDPSDLQAPKAAAEAPTSHTSAAAIIHSEAGQNPPQNPDNPDKRNAPSAVDNSMKNQQDHPANPIPAATPEFFQNPDIPPQPATALHPPQEAEQASEPLPTGEGQSLPGQ